MDQALINIAIGLLGFIGSIAVGALGWFANNLWHKLEAHGQKLIELEVKIAGEYVSREDMTDIISDLKSTMVGLVTDLKSDIGYLRNRIDGLPQRRREDP